MLITGDVAVGRRISVIMTVASNVALQKETLLKIVKEEREALVNCAPNVALAPNVVLVQNVVLAQNVVLVENVVLVQNVVLAQNVASEGLLAEVLVREDQGMTEHKEPREALEAAHVVAAIGVDGADEC